MIAHFKGTVNFCIIMFKGAKITNRLRDKQRRFRSFFKLNAYIFGHIKSHGNLM